MKTSASLQGCLEDQPVISMASKKCIGAATEALPYESSRMSAVSVGYYTGNDFATRLDKATAASDRAKIIEGAVIERKD